MASRLIWMYACVRPWIFVRVSPAFKFEPIEAVKYDADVRIEGVCPNGSLQKNG